MNELLPYWYYFVPNYLLALLTYTILGRLLLSFFVPPDWDNYIWRAFRRLTDWLLRAVAFITPAALHGFVLLPLAAVWLLVIRVAFTLVMASLGLLPSVTPAPAS